MLFRHVRYKKRCISHLLTIPEDAAAEAASTSASQHALDSLGMMRAFTRKGLAERVQKGPWDWYGACLSLKRLGMKFA